MGSELIVSGNVVEVSLDGMPVSSVSSAPLAVPEVMRLAEGVWKIVWRTEKPVDRMRIEMVTAFPAKHTMIPAILYDGNPFGHDHEYKGYAMEGKDYVIAYHRSAIPSATVSRSEDVSVGMYGGMDSSCSMIPDSVCTKHRVQWPEEELPKTLRGGGWGDPYYGRIDPRREFTVTVCVGRNDNALRYMLDQAWREGMETHRMFVRDAKTVRALSIAYAKTLYSTQPDGFCGFNIGFALEKDIRQWTKRTGNPYEIGWCGQNASLAISLLRASVEDKDDALRDMGLRVLDSWCSMARSEQGYLLTRYGDSNASVIDATNLGAAGAAWLEAWQLTKAMGMERAQYRQAWEEIIDFIRKRMLESGQVGISWKASGETLALEGTAGSFLSLPFLAGYTIFGETALLEDAKRIYDFYISDFRQKSFCTSGALDTCCIDKEGAIPLLKSALALYDICHEQRYLEEALDAAYYLSTWQWHYSTPFAQNTLLGQLRYDTFGGTAVSTSHLHIDDFALCYIPELLHLAEVTGNAIWRERATAIWYNGIQCISDGSTHLTGEPPRPAGSADEAFFHTRWGFRSEPGREEGFDLSRWLVAWPCAFRLEVLRKCPEIACIEEIHSA